MISRRALPALMIVLLISGLSPPASAQGVLPRNIIPPRSTLDRLGLERNWFAAIPLRASREQVIVVSLAGDLVFAQTNAGSFFAFNAESGRLLWAAQLGAGSTEAQPATANSYAVFASDGFALHALDRKTGHELWKSNLGSLATSSTGANEDRAFVGLENGKLIAFNPRFIPSQRANTPQFGRTAGTTAWNWTTNAKITARPVPGGRVVAFASQDGKLYVAVDDKGDRDKPSVLFRWPASAPIVGSMATYGTRTLLVPASDGIISAVDLFNGKVSWSHATGASIVQEPLVGQKLLFVINAGGALTALDLDTGEVRWVLTSGADQLLSVGAKRVYLRTRDRDLVIVGRLDGSHLFDANATARRAGLNLRDYELALTNRENDRIYLATRSGLLLSLRESGQTRPLPIRAADSHPFGYIPPNATGDVPAAVKAASEAGKDGADASESEK